jgi:hypothetical protein
MRKCQCTNSTTASGLDQVSTPVYPYTYLTITTLEEAGILIIPGKHSNTRIKPLPLANGHGRYTAAINRATTERILDSVGEWPLHVTYKRLKFITTSLLKRLVYVLRDGHFASETAVRRFQN